MNVMGGDRRIGATGAAGVVSPALYPTFTIFFTNSQLTPRTNKISQFGDL